MYPVYLLLKNWSALPTGKKKTPWPPPLHKIPGHGGHGQVGASRGTVPSKLGRYWLATDFKKAADVKKILHNEVI